MKASRLGRVLVTVITILSLLQIGIMPANAANPATQKVWPPPPLMDPAKAVPFSHPEIDLLNPKSPLYNPDARYGIPGSRFGAPGQRSDWIPTIGGGKTGDMLLESGHRHFGAATNATTLNNYALQGFIPDLEIPSGTALYAPTMLGANRSPLEITTAYWWYGSTLWRTVSVTDHNITSNGFQHNLFLTTDYLVDNNYAASISYANGNWTAYIYNNTTQQWEIMYTRQGGTGPEPHGWGWNIWEEWYFDEYDWPNLYEAIYANEYKVYVGGSWYYVSGNNNNGWETSDLGAAPYVFDWITEFYHWMVNMSY